MAYDTANPPRLVSQPVGSDDGGKEWVYLSTDPIATVRQDGYFTNGYELGMRKGDFIKVVDTDASPIAGQICMVTQAEKDGTVDLSDGVAITATDTD